MRSSRKAVARGELLNASRRNFVPPLITVDFRLHRHARRAPSVIVPRVNQPFPREVAGRVPGPSFGDARQRARFRGTGATAPRVYLGVYIDLLRHV